MKKLYEILPVFLQNVLMTFVNNYKYYQKYGAIPFIKPLSKVYKELSIDDYNDDATLIRINKLIEYAVTNVPYYIDNKNKYPLIRSIEEINKLPVLNKDVLKKHNKEFISKESTKYNSYFFKTSGSTGTPIFGAISNTELKLRLTMFLKSLKLENIDYSKPLARFPGADVARKGAVYRKDSINKHLIFSIYHLSEKKIKEYHTALDSNKIEIIEGYPSTIVSLVRLLKLSNLNLPHVKHVLTTAEKLLPHHKEEIESFFNTKVFDFYGSSEGSVYMYLSNNGEYINCNRIGYLESVDENYNKVGLAQNGRMLVTSFTSSFTPLIRYDIGDYATITSEDKGIIKVSEIHGRQEDIFITPEGKSFGRFSLILKHLPETVLESQLILKQKSNVATLQYTSQKKLSKNDFVEFEKKMNTLLEMEFNVEYERLEHFDKTSRGKLSALKILKN